MPGIADEENAWQLLLGRDITPACRADVKEFMIGQEGLRRRPRGAGSLIIGVAGDAYESLVPALREAAVGGARTVLIILSSRGIAREAGEGIDHVVFLKRVPTDKQALIATIVLKQMLNMISTGTMVMMGKVDGNSMIATNASNNKLVDRCSRLVRERFTRRGLECPMEKEAIDALIQEIVATKKERSAAGIATPPPVAIATTMIHLRVGFDDATARLAAYNDNLDVIFTPKEEE